MDAIGWTDDQLSDSGTGPAVPAPVALPRKLAVIVPTPQRGRPIANLGKVFGQFAELQQQIAEQVVALEDSVEQQRQEVTLALSQLPAMRERVNWLMASFYEQSRKDELVREKLNRHGATLAALAEAVRAIHQGQMRWQAAVEEILQGLVGANDPPKER